MVFSARKFETIQGGNLQHLMADTALEPILSAIRSVLPKTAAAVPLHEPRFAGREWQLVKDCLDTGWVSSAGKYVDEFETRLRQLTGAKHAVAVVNGTAALHISLLLVGVRQGEEVLIPSLTFVATANAVSYCNATPHMVDSEESTLGIDPSKLGDYLEQIAEVRDHGCFNRITGRRIAAVVPMHTFGHPVRLDALMDVADQFKIDVVEDAAESLGSLYHGRHTGTFGKVGALSFNGNKIVTAGGGGAILTNDEELARSAKHLTTTARVAHAWSFIHDAVGYNYRLPNINAALGCAQLESLESFVKLKRRLAQSYLKAFESTPEVRFFIEPRNSRSNYWLNTLLLGDQVQHQRDALLAAANSEGIMVRPAWTLLHRLPMYMDCPRMDLATAESLENRIVNLPSSAILGEDIGTA